jgi:hypothetical protein
MQLLQALWKYLQFSWMLHVGPGHHGMAHPHVADIGEDFQICLVAANVLNKQSRIADKGWLSSLEFGRGAYNFSQQKSSFLRNFTRGIRIDGLLWTR